MKLTRDYPGKTQMVIIAIALLVICLGSGGCFLKKVNAGSGKGEKKVELKQWKLDEFLVNLADRNENRYLKVSLVLEVAGEPPKEGEGEGGGGGESIKARDAVITVLTRKTYNSLISETGKATLKAELKKAINEAMEGSIKVENIYFTSFAMQ